MAKINTLQLGKKIGALVAEELKTAGVNIHELPTDQREALGKTLLTAINLLAEKMRELASS